MNIDDNIKDIQYQIEKIEGKTIVHNIGNRIYGLGHLVLSVMGTYISPLTLPITIPLAIEGAADLTTGKHHFISYRLFKIHPKYELEKLLKEKSSLDGNLK